MAHSDNANVAVKRNAKLISPKVSNNLFLTDIRETVRPDMDSADPMCGRYIGSGESSNPFLVNLELTTEATELASCGALAYLQTPLFNGAWPPTTYGYPSIVLCRPQKYGLSPSCGLTL